MDKIKFLKRSLEVLESAEKQLMEAGVTREQFEKERSEIKQAIASLSGPLAASKDSESDKKII